VARIVGGPPRDKRVEIGLTYIYGIGLSRSKEILNATCKSRYPRQGAKDDVAAPRCGRKQPSS